MVHTHTCEIVAGRSVRWVGIVYGWGQRAVERRQSRGNSQCSVYCRDLGNLCLSPIEGEGYNRSSTLPNHPIPVQRRRKDLTTHRVG